MRYRSITVLLPLLTILAFGVVGCAASAQGTSGDRITQKDCIMKMDLSDSDTLNAWQVVNDGVMGGLSQGARFAEENYMVFRGIINTNGGGFSSIRTAMRPGQLSDAEGIRLRIRSDGRDYKMTFRTSERWRGRSVSYQAAIPITPAGEWADVLLPFDALDTTVFGRRVRVDPFDKSDVRELGIILADGRDGPFRLEVRSLGCATKET